ncbi:hypothetical protein EHEL_060660 [Encephalitozoon hellem ATCC 50504]|uniref:Uncharacterized protein n=1 Tax=Encephalitozoon hellem TaxID=27973 RepID=A0A9Q9C6C2_ENCHE|nr:uncharacterized protein EHEL_060660 [Encephalitozoon hellem ATCC 50504]AFM98438.1 hypothetical protein EHEL_060660 [Encephalitozoon hellem ATCC 50504]UTX43362.1 hypothetical protein GPU96_06g11090 [Encephalitozoon hellem]|eukprot:XP_003887419.1 hypothetical protein EHEL_060660 [Encephalitozoon hellem ATCC 50504]
MPLVDFISSFYKKHDSLYNTFVSACLELRECRDIKNSLGQIYKCLRHEQTRQISFRCLEYFMDNEMASFIYKLGSIEEKKVVMDFLVDLISILPAKCFSRLSSFFDSVFESRGTDELGLALAYSERIIVLGCSIRTALVDYSLRFFFEEGLEGEYSRACLVYLICSRRALDHLKSMRFAQAVIVRTNRMYLNLEEKMPLYLSLLQFISYYARKEADLCKVGSTPSGRKGHSPRIRGPGLHPARSPLLLVDEGDSAEPHSILDLLEFPHVHTTRTYIKILESTGSSNIRASLIDSVLTVIENIDDPAGFVRFCIENHPKLVAPYLIKNGGEDWSPTGVFQEVARMKGGRSSIEIPYACHVERHRISIVDFLIENSICDDLVFLFIWVVSKETFYTHFGRIQKMFKSHKTFWGDLWHLILTP